MLKEEEACVMMCHQTKQVWKGINLFRDGEDAAAAAAVRAEVVVVAAAAAVGVVRSRPSVTGASVQHRLTDVRAASGSRGSKRSNERS